MSGSSTTIDLTDTNVENVFGGRFVWLLPSLVAGVIIYLSYLFVHPYPIRGGGLYVAMADAIRTNGYQLPSHIAHYGSKSGIPFGYPPLVPYLLGVVRDVTNASPLALARNLPGVIFVATLPLVYNFARSLLRSRRKAGVATFIVAVSPETFYWHVIGGGLLRAPAFLLTVSGLIAGLKLFRTNRYRWLIVATVLFGLILATHLQYALFVGVSYLLMYARYDRSLVGLVSGAVVAIGGVILCAPWWVQTVTTHGLDIYLGLGGTSAAGNPISGIGRLTMIIPPRTELLTIWHVLVLFGIFYLIAHGRLFLPAWFTITAFLLTWPRFFVFVGALVVAIVVFEVLIPALDRPSVTRERDASFPVSVNQRVVAVLFLLFVAGYGITAGVLFVSGYPEPDTNTHGGLPDEHVTTSDVRAMEWIERNTAESATIAVEGAQSDWFPVLSDRTVVATPFGTEWNGVESFRRQRAAYTTLQNCETASCVTRAHEHLLQKPDYVYLKRESELRQSLVDSPGYRLVYENEEVLVFAVK